MLSSGDGTDGQVPTLESRAIRAVELEMLVPLDAFPTMSSMKEIASREVVSRQERVTSSPASWALDCLSPDRPSQAQLHPTVGRIDQAAQTHAYYHTLHDQLQRQRVSASEEAAQYLLSRLQDLKTQLGVTETPPFPRTISFNTPCASLFLLIAIKNVFHSSLSPRLLSPMKGAPPSMAASDLSQSGK